MTDAEIQPQHTGFFKKWSLGGKLRDTASEAKYLNSIEQALQEVVSSKQCIWKSWLLAVEFAGHIFDL